jgi:hypothetical protein
MCSRHAGRAQNGNFDAQTRPGASASFLDHICMFDADNETINRCNQLGFDLDQFFPPSKPIMTDLFYGGR